MIEKIEIIKIKIMIMRIVLQRERRRKRMMMILEICYWIDARKIKEKKACLKQIKNLLEVNILIYLIFQ